MNLGSEIDYFEVDTIGNVRHLHAGLDARQPGFRGDLGGYSYSAFGKVLSASDPGGLPAPSRSSPFLWQGKRLIAPNLYDSRARIWSADLGAFLQPDEYGFLTRTGTLWSWPGQNPFRYRDPSGRDGIVFGFSADFGAVSPFNYTTGVFDAGSPAGSLGFDSSSFNVGPGGSTGVGGQVGYFWGTANEFADATTIHMGAGPLGSLNFFWNHSDFWRSGFTYGNGFGEDLGLLWTGKSTTHFRPRPSSCPTRATPASLAPSPTGLPSAGSPSGGASGDPNSDDSKLGLQ